MDSDRLTSDPWEILTVWNKQTKHCLLETQDLFPPIPLNYHNPPLRRKKKKASHYIVSEGSSSLE